MIIRTPLDNVSHIKSLAIQHPQVACVLIGEMSRNESGTTETNRYPLVLIEWPSVKKPRSQDPLRMFGRVFVLATAPDAAYTDEDALVESTYQIAINLVAILQEQSEDSEYNFSLNAAEMTIDPIAYLGSDQQRGWVFPVEMEVDQSMCHDMALSIEDLCTPSFSWENKSPDEPLGANLSFEDTSILGDGLDSETWYWQEEIAQEDPAVFNPDDGIELGVVTDTGMDSRIIHVWLLLTLTNTVKLWAYARIDSSLADGVSTSIIPSYPI